MSAALKQKLEAIPGVHVREQAGLLTIEPVTEHDLVQAMIALRQSDRAVRLSTARMTRVGSFQDASLTVDVDAGVPMREVEERARGAGMTLGSLSPNAMNLCVGDFLEGAYGGLRAVPGGRLEPLSMSLRAVTPDALLTSSHASPRSAAGPDLDALYLGGGRTFGVISGATLRLFPKPQTTQRAAFSFAGSSSLVRSVIAALQDGVVIAHAVVEKRADRFVVTAEIHGSPDSVERDLSTLGHRATDSHGRGAAFGRDRVDADDERALSWREVTAALDEGEAMELWRIAVDGVIARGTAKGRALVGPSATLPALSGLALSVDTFGVMRMLS